MVDYSYSERISQNEQRIAELKGELYSKKLSIKALENENERCFDMMNKCTSSIDVDKSKKDKQILELKHIIEELKEKNKKLRKDNRNLKTELEYTSNKLNQEIDKLRYRLLSKESPRDDVILSDSFGEDNIFDKIKEEI